MKKILISIILTCFFFMLSFVVMAQPPSPPGPDTGDSEPIGGEVPIGSGIGILIALGAAYGGKKIYNLYSQDKEMLEE
ncbi:MAG: hypothetical protein U5L09_22125 [Bacteroidales bacterium]|nr:hypothetical protein [Bacteroidales bacterium]